MKRLNDKNELNTTSLNAGRVESGHDLNCNFGIEIKILSILTQSKLIQKSFNTSHPNNQMSHQIYIFFYDLVLSFLLLKYYSPTVAYGKTFILAKSCR